MREGWVIMAQKMNTQRGFESPHIFGSDIYTDKKIAESVMADAPKAGGFYGAHFYLLPVNIRD
jgi:hypothetical protein